MKVLTESELRSKIKTQKIEKYVIDKNVIVTPSAKEYLKSKKIELVINKEDKKEAIKTEDKKEENKVKPKFICNYTGGYLEKKPENMTQVFGNKLVFKDHPTIIFRGRLDSLQSKILEVQVIANKNKSNKLVKDLEELLQYVRKILRAEVMEEKIEATTLFGLKEDLIRKMSHYPKEYLGVEHIIPEYSMGEELVGLNSIRSSIREIEICSLPLKREDIQRSLNRLSSAVYIMMCRYAIGYYK